MSSSLFGTRQNSAPDFPGYRYPSNYSENQIWSYQSRHQQSPYPFSQPLNQPLYQPLSHSPYQCFYQSSCRPLQQPSYPVFYQPIAQPDWQASNSGPFGYPIQPYGWQRPEIIIPARGLESVLIAILLLVALDILFVRSRR